MYLWIVRVQRCCVRGGETNVEGIGSGKETECGAGCPRHRFSWTLETKPSHSHHLHMHYIPFLPTLSYRPWNNPYVLFQWIRRPHDFLYTFSDIVVELVDIDNLSYANIYRSKYYFVVCVCVSNVNKKINLLWLCRTGNCRSRLRRHSHYLELQRVGIWNIPKKTQSSLVPHCAAFVTLIYATQLLHDLRR